MGTTTKGLRYPEATTLGNTLHTRIKELADDANTQLTSRDTRLDGLDTKTNTTNATVLNRGLILSRHGSSLAAVTNVPNNDAAYTTHSLSPAMTVPAGARTALVSMGLAAHCVTNAQVHWQPGISTPALGGVGLFASISYIAVHNQANTQMNMGFHASSLIDMRSSVGQNLSLFVNAYNDSGSGAWVHAGYLVWTVSFLA